MRIKMTRGNGGKRRERLKMMQMEMTKG